VRKNAVDAQSRRVGQRRFGGRPTFCSVNRMKKVGRRSQSLAGPTLLVLRQVQELG